MKTDAVSDVVELWEAWIDKGCGRANVLYVVGNIMSGMGRIQPTLVKKIVQGAAPSHLILEVMPLQSSRRNRQVEVCYAEPVAYIGQYRQVSICSGEDIIVRIQDIEILD